MGMMMEPPSMEDFAIVMTVPDMPKPKPMGHMGPTEIGGGPEGSADELLGKIYGMLKCYFNGNPDACQPPKGGEEMKMDKKSDNKSDKKDEDEKDEL